MTKIDDFENRVPIDILYEEIQLQCGEKIKVYEMPSIHVLVQFIGYGKYINRDKYNVLMRGQPDLYSGKMIPSLFREGNPMSRLHKYGRNINLLRDNIRFFSKYNKLSLGSMLQHYGIKTPFIDLVDNVWVALWFSLHKAHSKCIGSNEHLYYYKTDEEYSYLFLMASETANAVGEKGVFKSEDTTLIDLRVALPSYFIRPHAQHAYMLCKNIKETTDFSDTKNTDVSDLIVGIARIPTKLGFDWLGDGEFLSVSGLFPSAYFDNGYAKVIKYYPRSTEDEIKHFGSIQIITD